MVGGDTGITTWKWYAIMDGALSSEITLNPFITPVHMSSSAQDSPPVKQRKAEDWVMAPREIERLREERERRTTEREDERDRRAAAREDERDRRAAEREVERDRRAAEREEERERQVLERERRREQEILQERGGGRKKCLLEKRNRKRSIEKEKRGEIKKLLLEKKSSFNSLRHFCPKNRRVTDKITFHFSKFQLLYIFYK